MSTSAQGHSGWLLTGLVVGLVGVLSSAMQLPGDDQLPPDAIASVNGQSVSRAKYEGYIAALAADTQQVATAEAAYILQRAIEEELLVQRGVEVGLLDSDKASRAALVNAMISMTTATAEARSPSDRELRKFYGDNSAYFTPSSQLRVRQLDQNSPLQIPNTLLPLAKLREYIGPAATDELSRQPIGYIRADAPRVELLERLPGATPAFDSIRDQVEAEYVRRAGDEALRQYLEWLAERAELRYAADAPTRG